MQQVPLNPIVGCITADQLQQVNCLWAQMISILTNKQALGQNPIMSPSSQIQQAPVDFQQLSNQLSNQLLMNNDSSVNNSGLVPLQNYQPSAVNQSTSKAAPSKQAQPQKKAGTSTPKGKAKSSQSNVKAAPAKAPATKAAEKKAPASSNNTANQSTAASHSEKQTTPNGKTTSAKGKNVAPKINASEGNKSAPVEKADAGAAAAAGAKKGNYKGKNAYMCFKDTVFKQYIADNPDKNHKEVMAIVGAAWKKMTDPEKEKYVKMSKDDIAARAAGGAPAPKSQSSTQAPKAEAKKPTPAKPAPTKAPAKPAPAKPAPEKTTKKPAKQAPKKVDETPKKPFYFYMAIRQSELKQEKELQDSGAPDAQNQQLPGTQDEILRHVEAEWEMLTEDQKSRFDIPKEMQAELRTRKQMDDVEVLRQLVLTQKLPPLSKPAFGQNSKQ